MATSTHDISARLRLNRQYLPSTFEERGTAVPFTTPLLAHARARLNYRESLELCVPRFADGEGQYVVPWAAARDMTPMTLHDRLLHEGIEENKACNPHDMRMVALSVAASGLAGPEVAAAAAKAVAEEEEAKAINHVVLILRVLQETGKGKLVDLRELTAAERQQQVRKALLTTANNLALPAEDLDRRLSDMSLITHTVGAPGNPVDGRLRTVYDRLVRYRDALRQWGAEQLHDAGERALFCADLADLTLATGAPLLKQIEGAIKSPYAAVVKWDRVETELRRMVGRLAWLLDGWDTVIAWWEGCADENDRIAAAEAMVAVLPLIPRLELDPSRHEEVAKLAESSRRWVRLNQDWLTGEIDVDTLRRIEAAKARAL